MLTKLEMYTDQRVGREWAHQIWYKFKRNIFGRIHRDLYYEVSEKVSSPGWIQVEQIVSNRLREDIMERI